ncbi:hypothetical protein [Streptomyces dubilierae]|uniref:Uncharacterized protein n=1 Tax=Streptomyces dubilierae TaxID=3075533 RepID=A0ABU2P6P8_9ACTN|nr:hypothetical protein [Streptomyces sp. DSM 41921]MDT0387821.1 hypothetical protein [Streptomyces sp. DSM 41921]
MATYYQAQVSEDQLEQSREQVEREGRKQAMRVSFWEEHRGIFGEKWSVHVMNRSPDPVRGVVLTLNVDNAPTSRPLMLHSLGPCTETVIQGKDLLDGLSFIRATKMTLRADALLFTDRDGANWRRTDEQLTRSGDIPKELMAPQWHLLLDTEAPTVKKMGACDEG